MHTSHGRDILYAFKENRSALHSGKNSNLLPVESETNGGGGTRRGLARARSVSRP